jgi:hypothetical protein
VAGFAVRGVDSGGQVMYARLVLRWLASRPLRSPPHRARQEDQHYYEPVRLPARQQFPPLTPPGACRHPSRYPTRAAISRAGSPPFHTDAADQARATSTPGTT